MLGSSLKTAYSNFLQPSMSQYTANNKYSGFPPMMSDGRALVGAYTPDAVRNAEIIEKFGIKNNWQYRQFMTKNANKIREDNFILASNDVGFTSRSVDVLTPK